ncbi:putative MFS multidrug transporter [Aspergillus uvarum CBS 121591]|uniref:Putative MFS multidrug transporter n=1 Tax=Aspergillus uvarum CBS 121591 TaxID=1448315 RepID=A0A319CAG8_9EURO|nr:putative MFS multidrug transporter [Aspergillus uvarum CBS 121591]PYH75483.1 putative MFS multidrug transporter [Aspergillus uvarum CBS 121591]
MPITDEDEAAHQAEIAASDLPPSEPKTEYANRAQTQHCECYTYVNNLVTWDGPDDPENPRNWPRSKKLIFTLVASLMIFNISFASSVFGSANKVVGAEFGVSSEVMDLSVTLFVAGFATGPLFWGPFSEVYGNTTPLAVAVLGAAIFQIPLGLAQNVQTVLVSRFLAGAIGSGVLAVGSGMFSKIFGPVSRALAVGFASTLMNMGSALGPIVGSYTVAYAGWRWVAWITLILCTVIGLIAACTIRECAGEVLLVRKARRLRKETGNAELRAPLEEEGIDFSDLIHHHLSKPLRMIVQEPILIIITVYLTVVYGSFYLAYDMFTYAFERRGWSSTTATLPFVAVYLGQIVAVLLWTVYNRGPFRRKLEEQGYCTPEDRLPPMLWGAVILPPSLFWFGWAMLTHWIAQVIAAFWVGLGLQLIFITGIVYIIDVYTTCPNSAISIHVVVRSLVSSTFSLWCTPMYDGLGVEWTATVLGAVALLLLPSPFIFRRYGVAIRKSSSFSDAPY